MKASLERLRDLTPTQDAELGGHDLAGARERFLQGATARRSRSRAWLLAAAALVSAALLLAVLWPGSWPWARALTFAVGTSDGRVGAWIAAGSDEPVPVRFSDGTSLVLQPAARARVVGSDARGARVLLESGTIHASVTHTDTSAWSFDAGPFEVQVTGTRFDLMWDPTKQELRIGLTDGSVVVTGACLSERRAVTAGQTLEVFCKEQRAILTEGAAQEVPSSTPVAGPRAPLPLPSSPTSSSSPSPSSSSQASPDREAPSSLPGEAPAPPPARSAWKQLMAENRYDDAMRAAEAEGFDALVAQGSAADLLALADVARFAGRAARAAQALTALRTRHAGSGESARAAFHLGRLAFDQRGAHAEAARWFSTYLQEQPGGGLAQEALGRLIECREAMGAASEAREAARRYLAAYPDGPHAERAKSLLAGE